MKYALLTLVTLGIITWGVWMVTSRADKTAQEIINVCNNRYEIATKNNNANGVSNSDNTRDNSRCQADARQSAETNKGHGIGTIAVGVIISFILHAAHKRASL